MTEQSAAAAIHYLGRTLTRAEVDAGAHALAGFLAGQGVGSHDRVLLQLQNMPQAVIACQAAWRLGATVVPVNPMYKAAELRHIVEDCGPSAAIVLDDLYATALEPVLAEFGHISTLTTSVADYADPAVATSLGLERTRSSGTWDFLTTTAGSDGPPSFDRAEQCAGEDVAALVYTSGTTGPPKGAMILHRNLTVERQLWREVLRPEPGDAIMGIAPCFHITGLVADLVVALDCHVPLVQMNRFDPAMALTWIERYRPTSMVAAITIYTALLNQPDLTPDKVRSLRTCLSGGAPVAPTTVMRWQDRTGVYIRNCYGLTETSSLVTLTPQGRQAPVDPGTGALSVGCAVAGTAVEIRDDRDQASPAGEVGEVVIRGPQVAAGYWGNREETEVAFRPSGMHTGDIGILDDDGWLYLIDRSKDLIVSSGYKVWPLEVEDVLMRHPAVSEAGVVGVPDDYRGEQVVAYVSLRPGESTDEATLIEFCRQCIAVFKAPRRVTILPELPKTASGKILRRQLREEPAS
ncbi:long-chain acyl-CoA synthetase [Prauserella aidingensis]|uniref:class I adenylate-forming enzyme family protein n=1 Tax=Prauserella aidingensis TaxID=387890 RepID=UPI0020A4DDD2|nr:AMP-binding protein [Prauserella aidingensis]MCP2255993.1 long-chain acyl-CoA synthetase [Prauserella aidingensis]